MVCYPELSPEHTKPYKILLSVPFLATRLSEYFVYRPVHSKTLGILSLLTCAVR